MPVTRSQTKSKLAQEFLADPEIRRRVDAFKEDLDLYLGGAIRTDTTNMPRKTSSRARQHLKAAVAKRKAKKFTTINDSGDKKSRAMKRSKGPFKSSVQAAVSNKQRIKNLEKGLRKLQLSTARHTKFYVTPVTISSVVNETTMKSYDLCSSAFLENVMAQIPITLDSAPATTQATDMTTVTRPTKWWYHIRANIQLRNNYLFPVDVRSYQVKPKVTSSLSPEAAWATGLTAMFISDGVYGDPCMSLSDSQLFKQTYKVLNRQANRLSPGEEVVLYFDMSGYWDQEYHDEVGSTYDTKYANLVLLHIRGVIAHDAGTEANIGYAEARLDGVLTRKCEISYPHTSATRTINTQLDLAAVADAKIAVKATDVENTLG